ncbi:hypothetical protein D3C72_1554690 [compost metagenome]
MSLHFAGCRLVVIAPHGVGHVGRRQSARRQFRRVDPQTHGQLLAAIHVDLGHPVDGGEHRLHHARQVIRQRGRGHALAGKADIGDGRGIAGRAFDDGVESAFGQLVAHLVDLGHHFRQRLRGIAVQFHAHGDRAAALHRGRGQIIDAFHRRHGLRDRLRDKTLHQFRRSARIRGFHRDGRRFEHRVLTDRQLQDGDHAQHQYQGTDHQRQHGAAYE